MKTSSKVMIVAGILAAGATITYFSLRPKKKKSGGNAAAQTGSNDVAGNLKSLNDYIQNNPNPNVDVVFNNGNGPTPIPPKYEVSTWEGFKNAVKYSSLWW